MLMWPLRVLIIDQSFAAIKRRKLRTEICGNDLVSWRVAVVVVDSPVLLFQCNLSDRNILNDSVIVLYASRPSEEELWRMRALKVPLLLTA